MKNNNDYSGVINIYKEKDYTSHDVVAIVRRELGYVKTGHTGTLDPNAVGVLPICLGRSTKLVDMVMNGTKTYRAEVIFGITTDTCDITGTILTQQTYNGTIDNICTVINSFVGEIVQVPPMYSAVKHKGKKLYEFARDGIEIERKERKINIDNIQIISVTKEKAVIEVVCSKGTYIRTLCVDIGEKLGCGATMGDLERVATGIFHKDNSITISELVSKNEQGKVNEVIIQADEFFDYPKIKVVSKANNYLYNGNNISKNYTNYEGEVSDLFRLYNSRNEFVGIYELVDNMFKSKILLYIGESDDYTK